MIKQFVSNLTSSQFIEYFKLVCVHKVGKLQSRFSSRGAIYTRCNSFTKSVGKDSVPKSAGRVAGRKFLSKSEIIRGNK